ncbi:TPA: hypothetical protein QDB23_001549 [Burkholderia vietnamiensis]|nr:hypothetical protein [Burkholderia vietnamiensis]
MSEPSNTDNPSTDTEPSLRRAFVVGLVRIAIALAIFWVVGKILVTHGQSVRFINDMVTTWPGPPSAAMFVTIGGIGTLCLTFAAVAGGAVLLLMFLVVVQIGGKDVFPQ